MQRDHTSIAAMLSCTNAGPLLPPLPPLPMSLPPLPPPPPTSSLSSTSERLQALADADGNEPGKLFVGGLSQSTGVASLRAHFSQFGELDTAVVMMDSQSGRSRGFGFVKFKDPASAAAALQWGASEHRLDGKEVDVKQSNVRVRGSRAAQTRHLKIFVGGIAPEADAELVRAHFSQFGRVLDVSLTLDPARQRHRGFAFVTFEDERVVQRLVQLHFVDMGHGRLVEVKAMKPPGGQQQQQQQLQQQQQQLQQQQQQQYSQLMMLQSHQQHHLLHPHHHYQQLQLQQQQQYHHLQLLPAASSIAATSGVGRGGMSAMSATALPLLAASCWQPVAFDPGPGFAWTTAPTAAASCWPEYQQQQQHQQQQHQQLLQQLQQHQQQHQQLSLVESAWLPQPLLATSAWPSLMPVQPLKQQHQQQHQQVRQVSSQELWQHLAVASKDASTSTTAAAASSSAANNAAGSSIGGSQSQQQQQQQQQQQHQQQQQLLLQSRAAGDFGSRSS